MSSISNTIKIACKLLYYQLINTEYRNNTRPVLVFLHEGLGSVAQWKDFPALLSRETKCAALVYDRYGYGKSDPYEGIRTKNYMSDEAFIYLPELLEKLGIIENVLLVGHSDGGTIALLYASQFQKKTTAVITEADHVLSEEITIKGVRNIVVEYEKGGLKKLLSKFHNEKTDALFYSWCNYWLSKEQQKWNIVDSLPLITSPVLAIQGKDDCYGTVKQLTTKLESIKGQTEILFIPDCGHVPHFEAQNLVFQKMSFFLNNVLQSIV